MALTRDFRETIQARARRDAAFRKALLREAIDCMLAGDVDTGKTVLRDYKPSDGLWPSEHLPSKRARARERLAHLLEGEVGNL